jgi:hypothetical protein
MGLLDDIRDESRGEPKTCSVADVLEQMDEKDRADLEAALVDKGVPHTAIVRVLNRRGFDQHEKRVGAHRSGKCVCNRNP